MTVVVKLGSSIVADERGEVRGERARQRLRAGRRAAPRRRGRGDGHLGRDRARLAADGAGAAPATGRRAAGRLGGRPGHALSRLRVAARRRGGARGAGAADLVRPLGADALPERAPGAAAAAASGARSRSSTRTTPRRPTRSRSATTTSSRRSSRCCSARGCWSCSPTRPGSHTADPGRDPGGASGSRRSTTSPSSTATRSATGRSLYGSGGMRSKVAAAGMASAAGIPAVICDGTRGRLAARRGARRGRRHAVRRPIPSGRPRSSSGCATRSRPAGG